MRKIDDTELLRLADTGTPQKEIASSMGVTEAAISKRLKRLRQYANRPAILDKLTTKEQRFVSAIVEGRSQTDAAGWAFDTCSRESSKSLGYRLRQKPEIVEAITALMDMDGLDRRYLLRKLKGHVDGPDPGVSLRAVDMGLKLHDAYPAQRHVNLNVNMDIDPVDLSIFRQRY